MCSIHLPPLLRHIKGKQSRLTRTFCLLQLPYCGTDRRWNWLDRLHDFKNRYMRKKWSIVGGVAMVVFLANLTALAAGEESGSRRLRGRWSAAVFWVERFTQKGRRLSRLRASQFVGMKPPESSKRLHRPLVRPATSVSRCSLKGSPTVVTLVSVWTGFPSDRCVVVTWCLPLWRRQQRTMGLPFPCFAHWFWGREAVGTLINRDKIGGVGV